MSSQAKLRLLLVCSENRCRSALAECAMRYDWIGCAFSVFSAGLDATDGLPAHDLARVAAIDAGLIEIETHRSRRLSLASLHQADLILVMDDKQQREVLKRLPNFTGRVFPLGYWLGESIVDPVTTGAASAAPCLSLIRACLGEWRLHLETVGLLPPLRTSFEEASRDGQRNTG